ncbi:MAG: DUF6440 family protein [Clostridiales bacterium]|nr:DUF6440 family protein [Clostridiales bacterium]
MMEIMEMAHDLTYRVLVEVYTGVMYLETTKGITVMMDGEGKPLRRSKWEQMKNLADKREIFEVAVKRS